MGPLLGGFPPLRYSSAATSVVFDGNSLVQGNGATVPLPAAFQAMAPVSDQFTVVNLGIGGQTTRQMNGLDGGSAADVDAAFVAGKTNVLFAWEGTNSIANAGRTGLQAASDMADYVAARLAAHPWRIVLMTTIPRFGTPAFYTIDQLNVELLAYNAYLLANYRAMGSVGIVDVRAAGIFTYTGPTMNSTMSPYMADPVHCNNAGFALIAGYCAAVARRLRR